MSEQSDGSVAMTGSVEVAVADVAAVLQFVDTYIPNSLVTAWEAPINRACSRLADAIGYPVLEGEHRPSQKTAQEADRG